MRLTPERIEGALPAPGEPARLFNEPIIPPAGSRLGASKPDLAALAQKQIITLEITMKSQWSVTDISPGSVGQRLHKRQQAASIMQNLQPALAKNPDLRVLVVIASDREPDNTAREELTNLARSHLGERISGIKWLILPSF